MTEKNEAAEEKIGVECDQCGCMDNSVVRTRRHWGRIERLRSCRYCGYEFWSVERPEVIEQLKKEKK